MPSRVWISIPRHSLACFTRATRRVILCPPPSSSHAKDYRLFAHRPQSHVSPARISLRRMRSQVAQAQSSKIPLTMRCPGPDKVNEQEAMTGSMSGKEKHDAEYRQGSLPFRLDSFLRPAAVAAASCWLGCPYQSRRHFDFGTWVLTWLFLPFFSFRKICRIGCSRAVVVNSNMSRGKYLAREGPGSRLSHRRLAFARRARDWYIVHRPRSWRWTSRCH